MRKLKQILSESELSLDNTEQKKILRKILLEERRQLYEKADEKDWGARQFFRALELLNLTVEDMHKSQKEKKFLIACYFPIQSELNIASLAGEKWVFPKMGPDRNLLWFEYGDGVTGYQKGKFGIPEKDLKSCFEYTSEMQHMIVFVPGIACSVDGHRLGYGGGFYDRFIKKQRNNITTVFCLPSKSFLIDKVPNESFDEKVDLIVW